MEIHELTDQYKDRALLCDEMGPVMENLVRQLLNAAGVRVHSVNHRVKRAASFRRKVSRPGNGYESIDQIHDILGLRVVTYFPDEVDRVASVVEDHFSIDRENSVDKRALLEPDRFGYLSRHYVCALNEARADLVEHARFAGIKCEIQIRSILQHAWAEIEHDLGYTTSAEIPASVRRRFYRLAGLLEIADAEFESLRDEVGQYQQQARKRVTEAPRKVPIDRDTIEAYVATSPVVDNIAEFMSEHVGHARAEPIDTSYAGSLVNAFEHLDVSTIGEVDEELREHAEIVKQFFAEWVTSIRVGDLSRGAVLFYLAYVLAGRQEDEQTLIEYLESRHFRQPAPAMAEEVKATYARAEAAVRANGGTAPGGRAAEPTK